MSNPRSPKGASSATGATPPLVNEQPISQTTPRRIKVPSYEIFQATSEDLQKTRQNILNETAGHFIGPMPVEDFFESFMPWNEGVLETYKTEAPSQTRVNRIISLPDCSERKVYSQFVTAFKGWRGLRDPEGGAKSSPLIFMDSHNNRDQDCRSYSVGISIYADNLTPREQARVMDFANVHCWVEIKPKAGFDAFDDGQEDESVDEDREYGESDDVETEDENAASPELDTIPDGEPEFEQAQVDIYGFAGFPFEKSSKSACNTRAQLAGYAAAVMAIQYRQHLFSVLIAGDRARFIRWDRGAAVVTKAFNITRKPMPLFTFFKRFRQLTLEQRGSNCNVQPASEKESAIAREHLGSLPPELWLGVAGSMFLKNVDIDNEPFLKVKFGDKTFIVPAPHLNERGLSPFGRASRGRAAILLGDEPNVCYLKDAWRDAHRTSEVEIYQHLKKCQVRNIATMLEGGDLGCKTDSHKYASEPWVRKGGSSFRNQELIGTFITLDVVGRSLMAFRKTHQLVGGLADGMQAYEDALKAGVIHRDISAHNIMLALDRSTNEWKGKLIDWDHAVFKSAVPDSTCGTGTWPFMSINLLRHPSALHTEVDDRESAVYVLLWIAIRHLRHKAPLPHYSTGVMLKAFDQHVWNDKLSTFIGGDSKFVLLQMLVGNTPVVFPQISLPSNELVDSPMAELVKSLAVAFFYRYYPLPNAEFTAHLDKTVNTPDWLITQLRNAYDILKQDTSDDDWVNNIQHRLPRPAPGHPEWQQSKYFNGYTLSRPGTKRSHVVPAEVDVEDQEPRAKRVKVT